MGFFPVHEEGYSVTDFPFRFPTHHPPTKFLSATHVTLGFSKT
jgi:hypothetical protein